VVSYNASKKYHEVYADSELHLLEGEDHSFSHNMDEAVAIAVDFIGKKSK
jgi:hypothetical protein